MRKVAPLYIYGLGQALFRVHDGALSPDCLAQQEDDRQAGKRCQGEIAEVIHIGQQQRLDIERTVDAAQSAGAGRCCSNLRSQRTDSLAELLLIDAAARSQVLDQVGLVQLRVPGQQCVSDRDADAAADIAQ